ncbi:telomere-protecting terminal protein Tpg [Kitasatospora sp. NPDC059973]|uniref:telomere-protecting terminal protein Tpg n=1 Tax=Kitasatospora sp. NPDC059973 TaxID=3347020 RepID=UPI0036B83B52
MTNKIGEALRARFTVQTKDIAKTPQGRFNALVRAETPKKGESPNTARLAERLGVSRRQVQRYLRGEAKIGNAKAETLKQLEAEARRQHQPRVFAQAQKRAQQGGLVVETRAKFGFSSEAGSTDDPRMRRLTEGLPSGMIPDIFEALRAGDEERLRELVAEGLAEEYFRLPGGGADGLDVELTDIDYIEFWTP